MEELNPEKHWLLRHLEEGMIHFRDKLQFELKSEFSIDLKKKKNIYTQEMYMFIPESLQINEETYPSKQFYLDETTFIRYKTPTFSIKQILNENNPLSPLTRIQNLKKTEGAFSKKSLFHELKMFGNIYRSTLRLAIKTIFDELSEIQNREIPEEIKNKILHLIEGLKDIRAKFERLKDEYAELKDEEINENFLKIHEFFHMITENFLLGFLDFLRKSSKNAEEIDRELVDFIHSLDSNQEDINDEKVLLNASFLNKFVYESLYLNNDRVDIQKKHRLFIAVITAAIAMSVYLGLLVWQAGSAGINSFPFIVFAVLLYVLKDRIKEGLKEAYAQNAYRWFPDFSTVIRGVEGRKIGTLNESVLFVDEKEVPEEFVRLKDDSGPESVLQYKREMILYSTQTQSRRNELAAIFRFNIHRFLQKANDSVQTRLRLIGNKLEERKLPKVYFLTILLKSTIGSYSEIKKFRVIINKSGIDRVQYFGTDRRSSK